MQLSFVAGEDGDAFAPTRNSHIPLLLIGRRLDGRIREQDVIDRLTLRRIRGDGKAAHKLPVIRCQDSPVGQFDSSIDANVLDRDQFSIGKMLTRTRASVGLQLQTVTGCQCKFRGLAHGQPIRKPERHRANFVRPFQNPASVTDGQRPTGLALLKSARITVQHQDRIVFVESSVSLLGVCQIDCFQGRHHPILRPEKSAGFQKGQTCRLVAITDRGLVLEGADKIRTVPFRFADRLTVCQPRELALAAGDRLQLKANARTRNGQRLANGELVTVKHVGADGRIRLTDGRILEKNYRQFVRGFAITSYASQGKTVDHVLFSDSAIKAATNQQQWYVTISRGRKGITIFTSDKAQLAENIQRSGDRPLALDLAKQRYFQSLGIPRRLWTRCLRNRAFAEGFRLSRLRSYTKLRARTIQQTQGVRVQ